MFAKPKLPLPLCPEKRPADSDCFLITMVTDEGSWSNWRSIVAASTDLFVSWLRENELELVSSSDTFMADLMELVTVADDMELVETSASFTGSSAQTESCLATIVTNVKVEINRGQAGRKENLFGPFLNSPALLFTVCPADEMFAFDTPGDQHSTYQADVV